MKIYINPFRCIIKQITEKDEAFLHFMDISYDLLWNKEDVLFILKLLSNTSEICMGKFDLFNKWILHSCDRINFLDKEYKNLLQSALKKVYLKPNTICASCKLFVKCSNIHLNLEELELLWKEIYKTKAEFLKGGK